MEKVTIKITADTTELEEAIDRCVEKLKKLAQLSEQAGKLSNIDIKN